MSLLKKTYLFLLLCIFAVSANAATNVILENSEELSFDKEHGRDYQILRGNVRFRHENAVMYCDSAYFYDTNNSFDAFGNCRVVQDTILTYRLHISSKLCRPRNEPNILCCCIRK